jgi:GTP-binding protein
LVDLPGYGFAKVPKKIRQHWGQVLSRYLLERQSLQGLIIVVDIRRGLTELDWGLIEMVNRNLPLHILLTKADKLKAGARQQAVKQIRQQLKGDDISVSAFSALSDFGLEQFESVCNRMLLVE